jgi:cytochrome b561
MQPPSTRYSTPSIVLHWLVGVALLAQILFGFMLDDIAPRGTPARAGVINLHKSIGIVLGLAVLLRLWWRLTHRPPPWPPSMPPWQQRVAVWTHRGLYACMVLMPLAGTVASNFSKHGIRFFGIAIKPLGPDLPAVYAFFNGLHVATGIVFTALIAVHVAAALKHVLVDRDEVFSRMLPLRRSSRAPDDELHGSRITRSP